MHKWDTHVLFLPLSLASYKQLSARPTIDSWFTVNSVISFITGIYDEAPKDTVTLNNEASELLINFSFSISFLRPLYD